VGSWPERTIACASWPIHHTRYAIDNFVRRARDSAWAPRFC